MRYSVYTAYDLRHGQKRVTQGRGGRTDEMKNFGITLPGVPTPTTTCRVFEDNVGALDLANTPKLRPRTKHLAVQLHHFRQYILNKQIAVEKVDTK